LWNDLGGILKDEPTHEDYKKHMHRESI
jgi:hypothetical protein